MVKLVIPLSFPFGVINTETPLDFDFDSNLIRVIPKKTADPIKFRVLLKKENTIVNSEINHGGIIIPPGSVSYFCTAREKPENVWQATVEIDTEKSSEEFEEELKFLIPIYLQGVLNILGYARVSPIIQNEDGSLLFNSQLANLVKPGQDWFALSFMLQFSHNKKFYTQSINTEGLELPVVDDYSELNTLLVEYATPLDWGAIEPMIKVLPINETSSFGRVLTELIRQHPGIDYIQMIGLLTSFIEGLLKINGANRYKFGIKLSNLFDNPALAPIAKKIYDSRSRFFHTGVAKTPDSIFEFIRIEFLLLCIKKLILHQLINPIETGSFDFPEID